MTGTRAEPWTVRRRLVLVTFLVSAAVAVVLVAVTNSIIDRTTRSVVGRVLDDRAAAVVEAVETGPDGSPPAAVLGPGTAVYLDGRLVAGSAPPLLRESFDRLSRTEGRRTASVGEEYRILAVPVARGDVPGVVVVAESLRPYERDERTGLVVAGSAGVVMVALASLVAAMISRRALRPVRQMAAAARAWSEHDLDRRFDLGPPSDELRALGQVLDELLDDVAAAIRAEQRLSAEMAHELRSPLTTVRATVELLASRADLDDDLRHDLAVIEKACASMSGTITVLLDEARGSAREARGLTGADDIAGALDAAAAGGRLVLDLPDGLELRVPTELVARILGPLVENGSRLATTVTVTARADGHGVDLLVSDDGPGVPADLVDRLFEPGVTDGGGAGLGLALARRLARGAGGDLGLDRSGGGSGATFVVRLPGRISGEG